MSITRRMPVTQVAPMAEVGTAEFRYDLDDPFAIAVVFDLSDEDNVWRFARDLLDRGLREHAGIGDVRVWPDGEQLIVALSSPEGSAQLSFDATAVRLFVRATYRAVPRGQESPDLDGLIDELLGGAR